MQECPKGFSWGFGVRNCYLLHFVVDGKGEFVNSYGNYKLEKGQGFIFYPGEKIFYKADDKKPWTYIWIGFNGRNISDILKSCNLTSKTPIFKFGNSFDILNIFAFAESLEIGRELYLFSEIYRFLFLNIKSELQSLSKMEVAKNYIIQNFSSDITVDAVARFVGFERKYFSKIFTKEIGVTPSRYILNVRMTNALELLKNTTLSVADISCSVGYGDLPTFSKAFKTFFNRNPTDIRNGKLPPLDGRHKY